MVRSHHLGYLLLLRDVGEGGGLGSVMCASWGCTVRVGVYSPLSCVGLQLLSVLFRRLMLKSFSYGLCVLSILCFYGDLCVQSVWLCACTCLPSRVEVVRSSSLASSLMV